MFLIFLDPAQVRSTTAVNGRCSNCTTVWSLAIRLQILSSNVSTLEQTSVSNPSSSSWSILRTSWSIVTLSLTFLNSSVNLWNVGISNSLDCHLVWRSICESSRRSRSLAWPVTMSMLPTSIRMVGSMVGNMVGRMVGSMMLV